MWLQEAAEPQFFPNRTPSNDGDRAFVDGLVRDVRRWYAGAEPSIDVATGVNGFQRGLAYSALRGLTLGAGGWRGFHFEKKGQGAAACIEVRRATAAEAAALEAAATERRIADVRARSELFLLLMHPLLLFSLCAGCCSYAAAVVRRLSVMFASCSAASVHARSNISALSFSYSLDELSCR